MRTFGILKNRCVLPTVLIWLGSSAGMAQTGPCATPIPGQLLRDLIVDGQRLASDLLVTVENFARTACAVAEGCVTSRGNHELIRFTSATPNIGQGDLVIGDPNNCPNLFRQSECHNHLHFKEYSDYRLWTESGYATWVQVRDLTQPTNTGANATALQDAATRGDLIVGRKQGFCIIDIYRYSSSASPTKKYTLCGGPGAVGNQGLQAGWADVYSQQLDCQFIQIDGLPEGVYVLEDHVNPEHLLPESDYANNTAIVRFWYIPGKGNHAGQVRLMN